jgi:hypothetical protein
MRLQTHQANSMRFTTVRKLGGMGMREVAMADQQDLGMQRASGPGELSTAPVEDASGASPQSAAVPAIPAEDLQEDLTDKESEAIVALVNEPTIARAAALIGVHERTLRRWLTDKPAFRKAYHAARREAFSHAIGLTQRYAPVAVSTLVQVMTDKGNPAGVRVAAAGILLRFGREGIELDELAQRLEALEQVQQPSGWNGR